MYSPICLFTYNRLDLTKRTVEELQKNYLAPESNLIIFSDGPKTPESSKQVMDLRKYLKTIEGFLSVEIYESPRNKGLADSIISGVSSVVEKYGKAIVLEDDLLTTPNFLSYMNQAMEYYENSKEIISICGYGLKIKKPYYYKEDVYLYGRSFSWGWATWVDRWETIDWEVKDWESFKYDKKMVKEFNKNGSDMFKMLKSVKESNGNSWAIRFGYAQFKQSKYSIMPFESLVQNIGFGTEGTNTRFKYSRFKISLSKGSITEFNFSRDIKIDKKIVKQCYAYHSILIRIYSRIRYILGI